MALVVSVSRRTCTLRALAFWVIGIPYRSMDLATVSRRVSGSVIDMNDMNDQAVAPATDTAFADLICADPEWVRAEFDALMTAEFGGPPAGPVPPAPPYVPAGRRPPGAAVPARPRILPPATATRSARDTQRRQRSPPHCRFRFSSGPEADLGGAGNLVWPE
jgi:hypothetical protein